MTLDARYDACERAHRMNLVEKILAAGIVVACVLLLARIANGRATCALARS